jgi:hypothetical protein
MRVDATFLRQLQGVPPLSERTSLTNLRNLRSYTGQYKETQMCSLSTHYSPYSQKHHGTIKIA